MTMNSLKRVLATALSVALLPLPSFSQSIKAPVLSAPTAAVSAAPAISASPAIAPLAAPALTPAFSAPSLTPLALTPALAAPSVPAAVKPALELVAAKVTAAKPGSAEAATALNLSYEGGSAASAGEPVSGAPSALKSALKPAAAADEPSEPTPPAPRQPRSGKANIGLIAGIAGAVVVIAVIVGLMIHNGNAKNKVWEQSRAAQEVVKIESAKRSGDAAELFKIEAEARGQQKTSLDADAAKAKTLDAFEGLVALRAGTSGNAASTKAEQRPGGQLPSAWKDRLTNAEAEARRAGTIAPLARTLADLKAEVTKEGVVGGVYAEDLRKFQAEVPTFGGAMGEQASKASAELGAFRAEASAEQALADQYTATMRQLVADRLAATSADFRAAQARADALTALAAGTLSTLDDLADKIDQNFKDMSAARRAQRDNLAEAKNHTADAVLDANGKPVLDADGKPKTVDNSQIWRDKAAQNSADAQAAAASAKSNIEALDRDLKALRLDRTAVAENLGLPRTASVGQPDWQNGVNRDLLNSWTLDQAAKDFTEAEANDARARFGTAKGEIASAQRTVDQRKQDVKRAIDEAIDQQVQRESKGW